VKRDLTPLFLSKQGVNNGGINILRSPQWAAIQEKHIDLFNAGNISEYWKRVTDEFWDTVNKGWLDDAISRGDSFRLVSNPADPLKYFKTADNGVDFLLDEAGNKIKSIFGREVDHLRSKGFTIRPDGTATR
jgi:hypothetical protein